MDTLDGLDTDFVRRQGLGSCERFLTITSISNPLGGVFSVITSIVNGVPSVIASALEPSTTSTSKSLTPIVYVTRVATSSTTPTTAPSESFLQNKPLEGGVFALVGIVVMIIIFVIITYAIRRRRRNRLENVIADAITFDPAVTEHYEDEEKRMNVSDKYRFSGSSSGHGHGFGYGPKPAHAPPIAPQYGYYGQGYEQQAAPYHVPSTQSSAHSHDNGVNTGGANLTRKYSDRKPVPPLLPNPVYDPSRSPVLPSHYYMQSQEPPIPQPTSPSTPTSNAAAPAATPALPDNLEEEPYTGMLKVVNN
ncbi:hypothetical protein DFH29DRAFT_906932 [Suillus ampliporus]|nr:hypothetical protein DFH29DRAFT_906932 [Suillus ampliporus]